MPDTAPIITLTSDFGLQDYYVAAMKASILEVNPNVRLIDISHQIPPQDIMAGAWVLRNSAFLFPKGTVHLAVVDPGVGTDRKPVAVEIDGHYFIGPDNGLFSLLNDEQYSAFEITNKQFYSERQSNTFHGRDIFAPAAAHLSANKDLHAMGKPVDELVSYRWASPITDDEGIQGMVLHIDHYGNLISNITAEQLRVVQQRGNFKIYVGSAILKKVNTTFADVSDGEPAAIIGSSGMLEVIINKGNASEMLSVQKGAAISVISIKK